ncbi:hypothetical protein GPECTOR_66g234 [Gonium pectorale]|uniref:Uncharacterized protein n=1 Tax=Gonium pectorale TaxID=33097 RepID=A0A150G3Q1_GONPE|nr:hypothetical protein GPECTOR_66g234 [Gonium pectorale]|eukprot:KXZ44506.1 hypothetical protein GPECTOR_66g234 [Gonium pectorale]
MAGNSTALHSAAQNGHVKCVVALLQAGANKEAATKDGHTPLHKAAKFGYVEAVRALLEAGANKEAADKDGRTALDIARANRKEGVVALLQTWQNSR